MCRSKYFDNNIVLKCNMHNLQSTNLFVKNDLYENEVLELQDVNIGSPGPDEINDANKEVIDAIKEVSGDNWKIGSYERQEFYKQSRSTYAYITTSERRPYCNFILTKGVIKPDGTVWIIDK